MTSEAISRRPAAVLFDCDGVLSDSETLSNLIVAEEVSARGHPMTPEEAGHAFLGSALPAMKPRIEALIGSLLPVDWVATMTRRVAETMAAQVMPIEGAGAALATLHAAGIPLAVASNSSRIELQAKLGRLGFLPFFAGRVFSFEDVAHPKPWPDMYLAAAAACGATPADCAVIEDSLPGIRAGIAAGCRTLGFTREYPAERLRAEGAQPFSSMAELPGLLGL